MTRTLGNMLLWLASNVGRLGFRLRGADVTGMACYLELALSPERRSAALKRAIELSVKQNGALDNGERVNTVAPK